MATPAEGEEVILLNGYNAGRVELYEKSWQYPSNYLYLSLPLNPLPQWVPPFSTRNCFILDEVVVWFCNRGLIGNEFQFVINDVIMLAVIAWNKRLAISGREMSRILIAHGMPAAHSNRAADLFDFSSHSMIAAAQRKPVKKWRDNQIEREWSCAMRMYGRL